MELAVMMTEPNCADYWSQLLTDCYCVVVCLCETQAAIV